MSKIITQQLARCWREPEGGSDSSSLAVVVSFNLSRDGRVVGQPRIVDAPASSDSFAQKAIRNAILAVEKCSPLKNLPEDLYNVWRLVEIKFEPDMAE